MTPWKSRDCLLPKAIEDDDDEDDDDEDNDDEDDVRKSLYVKHYLLNKKLQNER